MNNHFQNLFVSFKSVYMGWRQPGKAGAFSYVPRPPEAAQSPGLVFSTTYLRGKLAPSTVPLACARGRGFPHR